MEPYKIKKMPFDIELDKETLSLLLEAKENYGEYKGYLKSMKFDYKIFLESLLINEVYYSFKIDNMKIKREDMFYMPYSIKNNLTIEFNNSKRLLLVGLSNIDNNGLNVDLLNKLHKTLFNNCKKDNLTKGSGHFRKKQTYILKPGIAGSSVSFVPPVYTDINFGVKNLCEYINKNNDDSFVSSSLMHFQLERIHPYISGNGKLGRMIIPIVLAYYKKEPPILYLSESIDNLKNTYFTILSTDSQDDAYVFLKFMLKIISEQCILNIKKIKKINKMYEADYESFKEIIGGTTIYKVYPHIMKRVVFTVHDLVEDTKLHINSINKVLNKMVDTGYLTKEKKNGTNRVTFKYNNLFNLYCE